MLILEHAFMEMVLNRVDTKYLKSNIESINADKKCGLKEEFDIKKVII